MENQTPKGDVEVALEAAAKPFTEIVRTPAGDRHIIIYPSEQGWERETINFDKDQPAPARQTGTQIACDEQSFISLVNDFVSAASPTKIYVYGDPKGTKPPAITCITNDADADHNAWRDHRITYTPTTSLAWDCWTSHQNKLMDQLAFAEFIEDNNADIRTVEGYANPAQMLNFARALEINRDRSLKSAVNTTTGGMKMIFVDTETQATAEQIDAHRRFKIGIPVFWNGLQADAGYEIECRIKLRQTGPKVQFWYEMVRPDLALQTALADILQAIGKETEITPLFAAP
jgi:uncharacterized protein YfdQ (DUF2303 family)